MKSTAVCQFKFRESYRPYSIEKISDNNVLEWLEQHLFLMLTHPRPAEYKVFDGRESYPTDILQQYNEISDQTWNAIQNRDLPTLIQCVNSTRKIQRQLIPGYVSEAVGSELDFLEETGYGCKLMGAGGAGYVLIVADSQPDDTKKVIIRRQSLNL